MPFYFLPSSYTYCDKQSRNVIICTSTATEPIHAQPTRRLQLWSASPYDQGRAITHLHVPLLGVPAPHRRRDQQPSALPPRAGNLRRSSYGVDAESRKRKRIDLSFLSDMRLHRLLGG